MRYYRSGHGQKNLKPHKKWNVFNSKKIPKRKYKQYEDAAALRYANPFKPKTKRQHLPLKITVLPLLFIGWFAVLLLTPYFQINKISIEGTKILNNNEIEELVKGSLKKNSIVPANNYFIVNEDAIINLLKDKYSVNSVAVTKIFPDKLNIVVQEKASSAIYDNGRSYFLIDNGGAVIKFLKNTDPSEFITVAASTSTPDEVNTSSQNHFVAVNTAATASTTLEHLPNYRSLTQKYGKYPILYDLKQPDVSERSTVLDQSSIKGVIAFYNALERGVGVKVTYFTSKDMGAGITAYTDKSWRIIFEPTDNIESQVQNLEIFLKNSHPTEYVDLRYGERIYWK